MKQQTAVGIVLARTDFQEADRIITVLTPESGKLRLMARGVRRAKSKMAGGIELFSVTNLTYVQGRGELSTLISSRLVEHFGNIVRDVNRTMFGYEVLRRINRMTDETAEPGYYHLLRRSLQALDSLALPLPTVQFWFDLQLLRLMGQQPNLLTDAAGQPLETGKQYSFSVDDMAFAAAEAGQYDDKLIKLLRLGLTIDDPRRLISIEGLADLSQTARQLVQAMSRQYLPAAT